MEPAGARSLRSGSSGSASSAGAGGGAAEQDASGALLRSRILLSRQAQYASSMSPRMADREALLSSAAPPSGPAASAPPGAAQVQLATSWLPDALATNCMACRKEFNMLRRKHHCRLCGKIFCTRCTTGRIESAQAGALRVCDACLGEWTLSGRAQASGDTVTSTSSDWSSPPPSPYLPADAAALDEDETRAALHRHAHHQQPQPLLQTQPHTLPQQQSSATALAALGLELQPGEQVVRWFENLHWEFTNGRAALTTHRLVLVERGARQPMCCVPVMSLERVEIAFNEEFEAGVVSLFCKNLRFLRLVIFGMVCESRFPDFHALEQLLVGLAFPADPRASLASLAPAAASSPTGGSSSSSNNNKSSSSSNSTSSSSRTVIRSPSPGSSSSSNLLCGADSGCGQCCGAAHYDDLREWRRMLDAGQGGGHWRITEANAEFALCASYGPVLAVPASITDQELFEIAEFRGRRRVPILSWLDPESGAALVRCSQPHVGLARRRSLADEKLVATIALTAGQQGLVIVDARPVMNATVNMLTVRGGFEDISCYNETLARLREENYAAGASMPQARGARHVISLEFWDLPNVNNVRDSFRKVKPLVGYALKQPPRFPALCRDGATQSERNMLEHGREEQLSEDSDFEIRWLQSLSESKWLENLAYILRASVRVVRLIKVEGRSVLLHCSDGWDRTAQVASLAMLCSDGYYRTFEGFCALVEKEWLMAGHPFRKRTGTLEGAAKNQRTGVVKSAGGEKLSPVFLQFCDCVWQIMQQFPTALQFGQDMLVLLLDRLHDARHTTLLVDSRKEARELGLRGATPRGSCLWAELHQHRAQLLNAAYDPAQAEHVLLPAYSTKTLRFWGHYYLRYDDSCADAQQPSAHAAAAETAATPTATPTAAPAQEEASDEELAYSAVKPSNLSRTRGLRRSGSLHSPGMDAGSDALVASLQARLAVAEAELARLRKTAQHDGAFATANAKQSAPAAPLHPLA